MTTSSPPAMPEHPPRSEPVRYRVDAGVVSQDRDKATAIWRDSGFGVHSPQDRNARYDWFYSKAPHGEGQINFLSDGGQPLGFLGVGLRDWLLRGERIAAGVLVDFVVHPQHRTASPALMLQRYGRTRAAQLAPILYGIPDTKAVAIFKRLGSQFECRLPRFARVLRSSIYLRRLLPGWVVQPLAAFIDTLDLWSMHLQLLWSRTGGSWAPDFDARFDELWSRFETRNRCVGVRDRKFLAWRFAQHPGHRYRIFTVTRRGSDALLMYFVCEQGPETLVVKDCINIGSEVEARHGFLMLSLAARRLGALAISMELQGDPVLSKALRRAQFIERDGRTFFATVAQEAREQAAGAVWYVTPADEDV